MKNNSQNQQNSSLDIFFHNMISEMYWVEKHLGNVLQTMKQTATTEALKEAFDKHMAETQVQLQRISQVFSEIGKPITEKNCVGMQGLFDEGWQVIDETEEGSFQRDVALIIAAQKVEHYEIACYGTLIHLATLLKHSAVVDLFRASLDEEKETDLKLSRLADEQINQRAKEEQQPESTDGKVKVTKSKSQAGKAKTTKGRTSSKEKQEPQPAAPETAKTKKTKK